MSQTEVKNIIIKPFDTVFLIVFGFIFTEHVKNLVQLFLDKKKFSTILLGIAIFLLLFLSISETVIDYSTSREKINSEKVIPNLFRHLVWFIQFFPIYYVVIVLADAKISEEIKSITISFSMSIIYFVYLLINLIKFYGCKKEQVKGYSKNVGFYLLIVLFYFLNGHCFVSCQSSPETLLSLFIIFILIIYILVWKKYYQKKLFEADI